MKNNGGCVGHRLRHSLLSGQNSGRRPNQQSGGEEKPTAGSIHVPLPQGLPRRGADETIKKKPAGNKLQAAAMKYRQRGQSGWSISPPPRVVIPQGPLASS
jgi:hypothetical protein